MTTVICLHYCRIYISVVFTFLFIRGFSQSDTVIVKYSERPSGLDSLFYSEYPINCTLKTDLKKFQKEKYKGEYQKAQFIYSFQDNLVAKNIRIKSRGKIRKKVCSMPPVRIKFQKKKHITGNNYGNKLKLVTHCNSNSNYTDYLLKEYLTYKIYNLVTPYSLRVRLLKLIYIDTGRKNKQTEHWAFFIEPIEMVAKRSNCVPINIDQLGIRHMDSSSIDLLAMWAYMVGNFDWSVPGRHNIKLLKYSDHNKPYPIAVPYDFDYCGLVNTHYAVPGDGSGLQNVRERLFMGPCRDIEDYAKAANIIQAKKNEIFEMINTFEYIDAKTKMEMLDYLESFFNLIQKPDYIKYHIDPDCREPGFEEE